MSRDDLFERADRAHAESLRLMTQGPIAVDHTLTMLHEFVLSHEKTLELLGHAIQRLEKAGRQSVIRETLAEARQHHPRVGSDKDDAGGRVAISAKSSGSFP